MSRSGDGLTSRRAFAAGAGLAAVAALGAPAQAQVQSQDTPPATGPETNTAQPAPNQAAPFPSEPMPPGPTPYSAPTPNSPGRQRDLGKLSNVIYNNPELREQFIADPQSFAAKLGLRNISAADLANIRTNFADGFCCMGCGC